LGKNGLGFGKERARIWVKTGWDLGKNGLDIIEMSII